MKVNQLRAATRELDALVTFAEGGAGDPAALAAVGRDVVMLEASKALHGLNAKERERLRQELRMFLHAAGGRPATDYQQATTIRPELVPLLGRLRQPRQAGRLLFGVNGAPRDVLLYQVATFLAIVGEHRLGFCPAPDCGRIFIKVTKKRFCSQRCQSRIYMRQLRADERAERDALTKGARHGKTTRTR